MDFSVGRVRRVDRDRVRLAVATLTLAALLARLAALGARPFHWDEARVGYWTLRYAETGAFAYRPVAGGPLLYVIDRWLFALVGASDAVARLPVAVIGGLLPLAALPFRTRLGDLETVGVAFFLTFSPPLLYYSRFLRGDLPTAAFLLAALGFAVRARDRGDRRALYVGGVAVGAALASSAFVVAHLICWVIAGLLTFDHHRVAHAGGAAVRERVASAGRDARTWATPLVGAALLALATAFAFYAPRAGATGGPGLWRPAALPAAVGAAFRGSVRKFWGVYVVGREGHPLLPFVAEFTGVVVATALPLAAFGVAGVLVERYRDGRPRPAVAFAGFWGLATFLVVPAATEVSAPWLAVHALVPLAVPAGVAGGRFASFAGDALRRDDDVGTTAAALIAVAVVSHVAAAGGVAAYGPVNPTGDLTQFAQPADDLDPLAADLRRAADSGGDGPDVLYVGERFLLEDGDAARPPVSEAWDRRLPLAWYVERAGATTDAVPSAAALPANPPPVVIADAGWRNALATRLDGYDARVYRLGSTDRRVVVFVDEDRIRRGSAGAVGSDG